MEWFDQGYWNFEREWHGDAVARQYLEGVWPNPDNRGGLYNQADATHPGRTRKGVTLDQARSQRWDIVLASLTANEAGLAKLAAETGATFGVQIGNVGQVFNVNWAPVRFALISSTLPAPLDVPHVIYRQEFRLSDFRYEWPPTEARSVASFIQCFPENKGFYDEFLAYAARMRGEFEWKVYGAYGSHAPDEWACGNLETTPSVAEHMRATRIAWHAKWWSDGYGHVIHNLYATGRPILAYHNYYADKLAGPLMEHGVTGFDLSRMSEAEVEATLRRLRDDDEYHQSISAATRERFDQVVDFEAEAEQVRALFSAVLS